MIPGAAFADADPALLPQDAQVCRQAVAAAERAHGIPAHLLSAIARVESGRLDPATGTYNPWPWTINMDGLGSFYDSKSSAVAAGRAMRPRVARSIDVGCMQISLTNHPDAFSSLEQAFDPQANADYGARFLVSLFEKTGSWQKAVAYYHSATPELGGEYQHRVYAALPSEENQPALPAPATSLAAAWAATIRPPALPLTLHSLPPRVIPLQSGTTGAVPMGRSLASYRANPVRLAYQAP